MAKEKRPAMPLYVRDVLADEHFQVMSLAERGAYMTLLMFCWQEGSIPDDPAKLARLCDCPEGEMAIVWPAIRPRFHKPRGGPRLIHRRLELARIGAELARQQRVNSAKIGAAKRWGDNKLHASATAGEKADAIPKVCLSSSIAVAVANKEEEKNQFNVFRSIYALTGKPVNEGDWIAASVEWISAELDEQAEAILAHLNALIGTSWKDNIRNREHKFIPAPVSWLRKKPWTRQPEAIARYQ